MAVPTQLSDLSATAASNSPAGGDTVGTTMDDFIRAHASIIARISAGTDALATPNIGAATGTSLVLSGLATVNGAFTSRGIDDNATAVALTLSGSGANSITIANSATNPTIGTSAGDLAVVSATGIFRNVSAGASSSIVSRNSGAGWGGFFADGATGSAAYYFMAINGTETGRMFSASDGIGFSTGATAAQQVSITHTASANRYITLTGSAGGNPTIGTSAGSLSLTSAVVTTSTLTVGTNLFANGYGQINSNDATPAGGGADHGLFIGSGGIGITVGSGAPTSVVADGSIYIRTDGGSGTTIYQRRAGNWIATAA